MNKLSYRIIAFTLIGFFIAAFIPRIVLVMIFGEEFVSSPDNDPFIIGALSSLFIYIIFYSLVIRQIVIKRINVLSAATQKVKEGQFDFQVVDQARDEIAQLTESFNAMTEGLKANEYLSQDFIKNFSHEFQTPLAVIKGYAELIPDTKISDEEKQKYLMIITQEVDRLSNMAHNILEISLLEDTSKPISKEKIFIKPMVEKIIESLKIKADEKSVSIQMDFERIEVSTNTNLIHQAILNLIDNAIKFSDANQTVIIRAKNTPVPSIQISNYGPVIPMEDHDKIFNMFYSHTSDSKTTSTGVGLTLVKKIVDRLDYEITFESHDHLTTFTLELK